MQGSWIYASLQRSEQYGKVFSYYGGHRACALDDECKVKHLMCRADATKMLARYALHVPQALAAAHMHSLGRLHSECQLSSCSLAVCSATHAQQVYITNLQKAASIHALVKRSAFTAHSRQGSITGQQSQAARKWTFNDICMVYSCACTL